MKQGIAFVGVVGAMLAMAALMANQFNAMWAEGVASLRIGTQGVSAEPSRQDPLNRLHAWLTQYPPEHVAFAASSLAFLMTCLTLLEMTPMLNGQSSIQDVSTEQALRLVVGVVMLSISCSLWIG